MTSQRPIKPLPFYAYWFTVLGLTSIGLLISIYLSVSHYRVHTDIGYRSFCALTQAINCDTVSQSPYSIIWNLPIAVWGIGGYGLYMVLVLFSGLSSAEQRRVWTLCFTAAMLFGVFSMVFAAVSAFHIGSYCILCIATYMVNLLLVYFTWVVRRRFNAGRLTSALWADVRFLGRRRCFSLPAFGLFLMGLVLTQLMFPSYWQISMPVIPSQAQTGMTTDGHPWIGAEQPQLEIIEFADYQCFQCRKMHHYLRELVAHYPEKIRLVHRSYPMDHEVNFIVPEPFHVGSGKLSLVSIYAAAIGKFWEMNDLLYRISRTKGAINLREIAAEAGVDVRELAAALKDPSLKKRLELDIRQGMKLRILGTPSYVVNGRVYQGFIPPEIISAAINEKIS